MSDTEERGTLVVSRKRGESIEILGGLIEVTLVEVRGDKVRLAVSAPKSCSIHRKEIAELIRKEQASA